jgi:MFS family permease
MTTPPSSHVSSRLARLPFFYGWVVVAVAFVTLGIGTNTRTAFSLLYPPILTEFGWDRGTTAAAFSFGFLAATLFSPLIGVLMDRWGPRLVIPLGAVVMSTGMALTSVITQPWQLYLTLGALVGGGSMALGYLGHALFLPYWFVRRRGLALGVAYSGVGVGSMLLFPWLQGFLTQRGWREACGVMAVLLLATVLPLNLLLQRRRPEELGLAPDGDPPAGAVEHAQRDDKAVVDPAWVATDWTLARALRTRRFWWLALASTTSLYAWYAVQVHQTKYLTELGFAPEVAAYALGLVGLTGSAGQILLGYVSDRLGREWGWTVSMAGFAVGYAVLLGMREQPTPGLLYAMVVAQGLLGYGMAAVFSAVPAELFAGKHYGAIAGMLSVAASLGAGTGPWVTGVLYDRTGSYGLAFGLGLGMSLAAIVGMWLAAPRKVRVVAGQVARLQAQRRRQARTEPA